MKKSGFSAFTLAEVLITLVIIGVIAALTVPTIIKNYQKKHFLVKLKDTYSILSNAKLRAEADYGPMKNWDGEEGSSIFDKYIKPYLKLTEYKKTHVSRTTQGVEHRAYGDPFQNSTTFRSDRYIMPNGVEISISSGCTIGSTHSMCNIYVDLNSSKKPNTYGKDIHSFLYVIKPQYNSHVPYKGKIVPGNPQVSSQSFCLVEDGGNYSWGIDSCTYNIFKNNWQYPSWFPW